MIAKKELQIPAAYSGQPVIILPGGAQDVESPIREKGAGMQRNDGNGIFIVFGILALLVLIGIYLSSRNQPLGNYTEARVAANSLYLREGPGTQFEATYLLPLDWPVTLLGETSQGSDGEAWVRIRLNTNQGAKEGWVAKKYLKQ
jgi:hypothetical protein